jgi:hypothetical protein
LERLFRVTPSRSALSMKRERKLQCRDGCSTEAPCVVCRKRARWHVWATNNPDKAKRARNVTPQDPEKIKVWKHRSRGVKDPESRGALERLQAGLCGICNQPKKLGLDHDHATGLARGMLCRTCNSGIGQFRDSIEALEAAIAYLKS